MYIFGVKNLSHELAEWADYSLHIPTPKSQAMFLLQYTVTELGLTDLQQSVTSRNKLPKETSEKLPPRKS